MPDNQSQPKKDINLLPEDMQRDIKPSVSMDIRDTRKQSQGREVTPMPKQEKKSLRERLFSKKQPQPEMPQDEQEEQPEEPEFKKGARPSFTVSVTDESPKKSSPPIPTPPASPQSSQPDTPSKPPSQTPAQAAEKAHPITLKLRDQSKSTAQPEPLEPVVPQEELPAPKPPSPELDLQAEKEEQPDRSHLSLSSIRDFLEHHDEQKKDDEAFGVNLIPQELQSAAALKSAITGIVATLVLTIVIIGAAYGGLTVYGDSNSARIAAIQEEVADYEAEIQEARETIAKLADFTKQTERVGEVLVGQERWSSLFAYLESAALPEIFFDAVDVINDDRVTLTVYAESYYDVARQYKVFEKNDDISNLQMTSATLNAEALQSYIDDVENSIADAIEEGEDPSEYEALLEQDALQSLLSVRTNITFNYKIQTASSTLDMYEQ